MDTNNEQNTTVYIGILRDGEVSSGILEYCPSLIEKAAAARGMIRSGVEVTGERLDAIMRSVAAGLKTPAH